MASKIIISLIAIVVICGFVLVGLGVVLPHILIG